VKLHEHSVEAVAAAREAIGSDVSLMVDVNCYWDRIDDVIAFCRAVERYDVDWLEEPLYPVDRFDMLADLRDKVGVPIAVGENIGNVNELRCLGRAADIVQPSAPKIGGVSGCWEAINYLRGEGIRIAPHSPFTGPALVATIHMIAAAGDGAACEHRFCDLEASPIGPCVAAQDGFLDLPTAPGLGFELDLEILDRYKVDH
jgi:L-alanine-DL-glutamate epimerase-like enolase superfamily enzyme